jgi:hypothetical protein
MTGTVGTLGMLGTLGILGMLGTPGKAATVIGAAVSVSPTSCLFPNSVIALFFGTAYSPLSFSSRTRNVSWRDALNSGE